MMVMVGGGGRIYIYIRKFDCFNNRFFLLLVFFSIWLSVLHHQSRKILHKSKEELWAPTVSVQYLSLGAKFEFTSH